MSREPPLLLLAEGRRARPRTVSTIRPREIVLHLAVIDVLRKLGDPAWRWSHMPTGEARDGRTGAKLKRMGTKPGWPDIMLLSPAGLFHGLELKREGEDLREEQQAFQLWAVSKGVRYAVVSTLDEALATLTGWHAIRSIAGERR